MATQTQEFLGTGRRKTAVARVRLAAGTGKITVNGRAFETYFPTETLRGVVRPATGLAVDGDEAPAMVGVGRDCGADPGQEAALECLRFEGHEQAADAITRGDAVGQGEVLGQPGGPMPGPAMDGGGPIGSAEDAADGDDGDIDQEVLAIARVPRIGERFEVRADGADVSELGHGGHPGIGR